MEMKQAAIRAKQEQEMAETLIRNKDYREASLKLSQARKIFPLLDNIEAMINVCNILHVSHYLSSKESTTDWYMVLQVDPKADMSHIVSKYREIVESFNPIKNTFPGTDSALKVLSEAFFVLSDKKRRLEFDLKRLNKHNMVSPANKSDSSELSSSRLRNIARGSGDAEREIPEVLNSVPLHNGVSCGNKLEAVKNLACKKKLVFEAKYCDFDCGRKPEVFKVGQIWAAYDQENLPRRYAWIRWVIKEDGHLPFEVGVTWLKPVPITENEKRWCEVGLPVVCGGFSLPGDIKIVSEQGVFSHMISQFLKSEQVEICPKKGEVWAVFENWRPFDWCKDPKTRKGCGYLMVEIVMEYSKNVGITVARLEKVAGFQSIFQRCMDVAGGSTFTVPASHLLRFSHNVPAYRFRGGEIDEVLAGMLELDPSVVPVDSVQGMEKQLEGRNSGDSSSFGKGGRVALFVDLEPECKWSRKDFAIDQVWAVYDGPDFMPRRYVVVNNVVSRIEVCVTFLDPYPLLDAEKQWVEESLPFACGLFKPGRTITSLSMLQFSHVVSCEVSKQKSLYRIYPEKGEVWAVYKSWHPKWKNGDFKSHQCQIIEVLSNFSEGVEMSIASLVEIGGYMTFFQRQQVNGFDLIRTITRMEMLSFSHQIPSFSVEGSLHLEPDALPLRS
ncbi:hypothetical protein AQUCO_04300012v1 [Aquilegia coerulea]|uniref:J domain-containing protein n=1 Tax=Aquilegia coerulea TaxID=218851 RepID=A0A2G5CNM7_AQUCA|nr:hypothetical protein AQUCO_04300012v1 [Aquilegia coerulea]